jgi:hypothetical protein
MPGPAYLSGKYCFIKFATVPQQMDVWDLEESAEFVDCTNFMSLGHEDGVDGIEAGTWSTSGPWGGGALPTKGSVIEVVFGATTLITETRRVYVERAKRNAPVKGKVTVDISGKILPIYA